MNEVMSYEEFLKQVKVGIVTARGNCPITPLLMMLQGKWKNQVLYELCIKEPIRFGELKKNLAGITNTMLTSTLRDLERDRLIQREQFNEIPPHVEYSLTAKGRDLMPIFYAMMNWGFKYEDENEALLAEESAK
ncbi:MAG: helix-turn-helix transcriptional regulator [Oscillibacter sp.]|nr:helix-turn-helix transcriptional regulator [Oscillibacter sp.]